MKKRVLVLACVSFCLPMSVYAMTYKEAHRLADEAFFHKSISSLKKLELSAAEGNEFAEYWLAVYFHSSHHYKQSANWYQKAAEQGYAKAEFNLGVAYYKGKGVPQDSVTALYWLKKAAAQGYQKAERAVQIITRG